MKIITNAIDIARRVIWAQIHRSFVLVLSFLIAVGPATLLVGHASASTPQAVVGMPFSGQWAYNVLVNPPYTDTNSSHPCCHWTPGGGDWATDVYAAEGTPVKLDVTYVTGTLSFSWKSTSTTCGQSTGVNVIVDGTTIGWLYFAHLNNAVTSGTITNGMTLGTVHDWGGCNPGVHVHIEFKNTNNYACYADNGQPGVTLNYGANLGVLGSSNTGAKQACSSIPPSLPTFNGVGNATFFGSAQLNNGQTLQDNYYLTSGNVQYALIMQADGNLVLYGGSSALWASGTNGNPGAYLGVQSDGNIVIYNSSGQAIWATNTNGQSTSYLVIQTDGNLVAYNTSGTAVWASNTGGHSTDTYYGADRAYNGATVNGGYYIRSSDLRYAMMMQSDGNLVLYGPGYHVLWANNENGNPGAYLGLQSDGNIVEYSSSGHALWATNTGGQSLNYLVMQSDGNLVAYNTSGGAIWATGTNGKI